MHTFDIQKILRKLGQERPIFHSEADFQHALAWKIHLMYNDAKIRLEFNPYTEGQRTHIDTLIQIQEIKYAIELKYKTRKLDVDFNGESFHLLNQSAQDIGRYDFLKDVVRLEKFVSNYDHAKGIAIFLTNDRGYWQKASNGNTVDNAFRIFEDRVITGNLNWDDRASAGTKRGRENDLVIKEKYTLKWKNYSNIEKGTQRQFRYLLVEI